MTQRKYPAGDDVSGFTAAESAEGAWFAELAARSMVGMAAFILYVRLPVRKIPDRIRAGR